MAVKYSFKGSSNGLNPPLILVRGVTYTFNVNTPGHPFWIKASPVTGTAGVYSNGVTNNGASSGTITFIVPQTAPNILYYVSQNDVKLVNEIFVVNSTISIIGDPYIQGNARVSGSIGISGSLNISGSQTLSGSLFVTGSQIITGSSNISGSTFLTGSARITGSQLITGSSNISGSTFLTGSSFITGALAVSGSTSLSGSVNIFGSGSVSGSWTVTGDITARQIIISSSIIYVTESYADGSHKFGNTQDDTHQFTGSVFISHSLTSLAFTGSSYTGSFTGSFNGTASWAISASNVVSSSYAYTASRIEPIPAGTTETNIVVLNNDGNLKYRSDLSLTGPTGPTGPTGGTGPTGPPGPPGSTPSTADFITNTADSYSYTGTAKITSIITLSQAEYDAIGSKDSATLYVII